MNEITAKLIWKGGLSFTGTNPGGIETATDGDRRSGASPMELLLEALGACPTTHVVSILERMREPLRRLEVNLEGDRHSPEPRFLIAARVRFDLWGDGLNSDKVTRAIGLAFAKHCSVYHSLRPDPELQPEFRIHKTGEDATGEYRPVKVADFAK